VGADKLQVVVDAAREAVRFFSPDDKEFAIVALDDRVKELEAAAFVPYEATGIATRYAIVAEHGAMGWGVDPGGNYRSIPLINLTRIPTHDEYPWCDRIAGIIYAALLEADASKEEGR
jgi:hypothetical protein